MTYGHNAVDYDNEILLNFNPGDSLFIQLKVNFNRDIEFLVYDKTMALDMLFHYNSIQNDGNAIQKVH